jgi:type II secretory pathway pseudopilin PulG
MGIDIALIIIAIIGLAATGVSTGLQHGANEDARKDSLSQANRNRENILHQRRIDNQTNRAELAINQKQLDYNEMTAKEDAKNYAKKQKDAVNKYNLSAMDSISENSNSNYEQDKLVKRSFLDRWNA